MLIREFVAVLSRLLSIENGDFLVMRTAERLRNFLGKVHDVVLVGCKSGIAREGTRLAGRE
jgi:hypothetical protein